LLTGTAYNSEHHHERRCCAGGQQQQRLGVPGLEPDDRQRRPSGELLRRGFGVRYRRHGVCGQSAGRKVAEIVSRSAVRLPVDQTETGKGH